LVVLIIGACHYIFGLHFFYGQIFSFDNDEAINNRSTYASNRHQFFNEYDRANPLTQGKATKDYLNFIKGKIQNHLKNLPSIQ
jgi:hypothetical protein